MTWRPTGSPSTVPAGMDTAGLPVRLAGMVSAPLLPTALLKPYSLMRSTPPTVVGMGPVAAKAVSGLVAQKTKSVCSNRVAICSLTVDAEHLGPARRLHVEVVGGQVEAELDLGGEVVVAAGVEVAQLAGQADRVGHDPLEAALGQVDHHVHPPEAGLGDECLGQRGDHLRRRGARRRRHPGRRR